MAGLRDQHDLLRRNPLAALCRAPNSSPLAAHQARPLPSLRLSDRRERDLHRVRQASSNQVRCTAMKRRLPKIGLLILAGAILNVAVAWAAVLVSGPSFFQR